MAIVEEQAVCARIETLLRALLKIQMAPILQSELSDDFSRKLFALTGKVPMREIQKRLRCGPNRICNIWARWDELGIITKHGSTYRKVL